MMRLWLGLIFCLVSTVTFASQYKIERVKDNVYRFTSGHYHSVFMVTEQGAFVTDPISAEAALYLKAYIKQTFDVPIRYLAYSHNHIDHTLGGEHLADSQVAVLAHEYAAEDLAWTLAPTAMPTQTFMDRTTVKLADSWVELRYHGPNNGRGSVSMRFMPANVMYVVDWIVIGRMPYQDLPGYDIHGMIRSTQEVLALPEFAVLVGGHANMGTRADVERYLQYLQTLYAAVRDGILAGKSLAQLQQEIKLDDYRDVAMYEEWLPQNIKGVHDTLMDMSYFNLR